MNAKMVKRTHKAIKGRLQHAQTGLIAWIIWFVCVSSGQHYDRDRAQKCAAKATPKPVISNVRKQGFIPALPKGAFAILVLILLSGVKSEFSADQPKQPVIERHAISYTICNKNSI